MTGLTIKLLGMLCVLTAVIGFIWIKIKEKRKNLDFVTDFISALKYIEDLIKVSALPFCDILEKTIYSAKESKAFFEKILSGIKSEENLTLDSIWTDALEFFSEKNSLSPKTVDVIKRLGSHIGTMSVEIETENLSFAQRELDAEKQRLVLEFEKHAKLLKSLGFAFGGFIILIFI